MATAATAETAPRLVRASDRDLEALADDELLARFFQSRDDAAFEILVGRFGPLVYGVCRRILPDPNDAEDVFQATFLVLVKKGKSLANPRRLGSWLYGVAFRIARKARAKAAHRSKSEREAVQMPSTSDVDAITYQELSAILGEEIAQLPEKYALPLVLCYLEGKTNAEAAAQLGWPEGSMSRRLSRARQLLRDRLTRRGLTLSAALMACVFSSPVAAQVSPLLAESTARAACLAAGGVSIGEVVSPAVAELVRESAGLTAAGKLAISAAIALASLLIAAVSIVRQFDAPGNAAPPGGAGTAAVATEVCLPAAGATDPSAPVASESDR
jgi:RNA polymerase sigma factor (sigma-70 family)